MSSLCKNLLKKLETFYLTCRLSQTQFKIILLIPTSQFPRNLTLWRSNCFSGLCPFPPKLESSVQCTNTIIDCYSTVGAGPHPARLTPWTFIRLYPIADPCIFTIQLVASMQKCKALFYSFLLSLCYRNNSDVICASPLCPQRTNKAWGSLSPAPAHSHSLPTSLQGPDTAPPNAATKAARISNYQSWAHRSLKSLNHSWLLSKPSFWERWRSLRQRAKRNERTDKIKFWAVRSWAI